MQAKLKTIKLLVLIFQEYFKRHLQLVFMLSITAVAILFFAKNNLIAFEKSILTEGVIGTYQSHDLPEGVTRLLSSGLTELAESWQSNSDVNEFTFKLKKGVSWIDGTPIKSQDLEFVIPDVEVSFPDDQTVKFKLKDSFSPFPSLLTKPVFKKGSKLVGTGPYQVKDIQTSRIFISKLTLSPKDPNLPHLKIRFYPNEQTALTAFRLGEIQVVLGINDLSAFKKSALIKTKVQTLHSRMVTILYNTKDAALSSRSLRQALSFSAPEIDGEEVAKTPFSPTSWVYSEENIKNYLNNRTDAETALERARSASADILKKEIILTAIPQLEQTGKQIIKAWQDLGLNANMRVESGIPQNFQALLIIQEIPRDPDQYYLWHSTQTQTNLSKYSSPRADKDLEDARKSKDNEQRKLKYMDFQKVLMEDAPATFLYFPKYNIAYLKKGEKMLDQVISLQVPY